jgi:hypothetical protein
MSMSDIKKCLQQRGQAPLSDIVNHFGSEPGAVLAMLEHWQRKGRIGRFSVSRCSGCKRCEAAVADVFRWIG